MKKITREAIHYLILAILLTATVFLAHALSGFLETMVMSTSSLTSIFGWIFLAIWYFLFLAIVLVVSDLILHKILRI